MIRQKVAILFEDFKAQKAPKGKPDSGTYQERMRKRLKDAHRTYLDLGRKDLTKYGGGFHLDRPKDISNAFLAEEDIEEASGAAAIAGHVNGAFGKITHKRKSKKMNKVKQETRLRLQIREALKSFFNSKSEQHEEEVSKILEEHKLRMHLREVILEQSINESEDPTTDVHDNTGINTLKDLFKNTNILATLRTAYKTLTTNDDQKNSFRAHVLKWTVDTLAPVKLNDTDNGTQISEQSVGVDILGVDADPKMFLNFSDGSEKETDPEKEEEEEKMKGIEGEDTTGRNKAERIYPAIEKSVIDYYSELDNPEDQEMYYDYLIANLKLYFDKWDGEMSKSVEEPTNDEYDQAKQTA